MSKGLDSALVRFAAEFEVPDWLPVYDRRSLASEADSHAGIGSDYMAYRAVLGELWLELEAMVEICSIFGEGAHYNPMYRTSDKRRYERNGPMTQLELQRAIELAKFRNGQSGTPGYRGLLKQLLEVQAIRPLNE